MENNHSSRTLSGLLKDPTELFSLINNPGRYGMDFYKSLTKRDKQYVAFAAGAALILYGVYLNRKQD